MGKKVIALMATLDTKGHEVRYLKELIEKKGEKVLVIDTGLRGVPTGVRADITREMLAEASGSSMGILQKEGRGRAIEIMTKGIGQVVKGCYDRGKIQGIMAIGGMDGALLAAAGMRVLPLGVPKLIVTPIAEGKTLGTIIGTSDLIIMPSVVDILGIHEISKKIFANAVGAMVGMVDMKVSPHIRGKKIIATTMYGNTTPAVMMAKKLLEERGYQVVVFHPNGTGGRAMEELIEQGRFSAVLDMTPPEIIDELFQGVHSAGPHRLEAAGKKGIPQVVVSGCLDFILQGPLPTLPRKYKRRKMYYFNPAVTMVRTTPEEMVIIGRVMADKLNKSRGPTKVIIPLGGFSMYCHEGEPLHDPEGDRIFIESLKKHLRARIQVIEVDAHINDPLLAQTAVSALLKTIEPSSFSGPR